jgi:hypothetical protein
MDSEPRPIAGRRRHSKFGIASVVIAVFNAFIIIYFVWLLALWFMNHPEMVRDPARISGMRVSDSTAAMIFILVLMEVAGLFTGLLGLLEKGKRKLLPIIGLILNGLFFLLTAPKVSWKAWVEMAVGAVKLLGG